MTEATAAGSSCPFDQTSPCDLVFIDGPKKAESDASLAAVSPKLASRRIPVTDNTITHAPKLASFVDGLQWLPGFSSCGVPVGNGFELTARSE